jgi:hypothetical protein
MRVPTVVVDLPSPKGVGLMPPTLTERPNRSGFGAIFPVQTRGFRGSGKVNMRSKNRRFGLSVRVGGTDGGSGLALPQGGGVDARDAHIVPIRLVHHAVACLQEDLGLEVPVGLDLG